ncbi:MAG: FtsX-like permease family protein, partial [Bacteroidota bacterium]
LMNADDSAQYIVVNEAAAQMIGSRDILRKKVTIGGMERTIIGVSENHHYRSLQSQVKPVAFLVTTPGTRISPDNIIVRLNNDQLIETVSALEQVWKSFSTSEYFSFRFVDDAYTETYGSEYQFLNLFTIFAVLSIMISCMGLYGIVLFTTDSKSKEISIRKVLGSSVTQIIMLISRKFVVLVALGFVLGTPIAIYFANDWLTNFSYKIDVSYLTLALAALMILLLAIVTVGINTFKAAIANPADHLRNE